MTMLQVKSCGVIVFRREPQLSFLLMKHHNRWDIPKGHVDEGETDLQCALRELHEETGIPSTAVDIADSFLFRHKYVVRDPRYPMGIAEKSLLVYLGWLKHDVPIIVSEHIGSLWIPWQPPHDIQNKTIDPLLAAVEQFFDSSSKGEP